MVTGDDRSGICNRLLQFPSSDGATRTHYNRAMVDAPNVLLVDDDREIRDLLGRFLRKHGLRVETVADGGR